MKHTRWQGCAKKNENVIPAFIVCHSSLSGTVLKKDAGQASMTKGSFTGKSYSRKLFTVHGSLFTDKTGFTLIETIMVMVIIAILAVAVVVRNPFDAIKLRSAARKVAGDIRYAQKLAISTQLRCGLIRNSNTSYTVFEQNNIANPAPSPGDICSTAPDGGDLDAADDFIVDTSQSRCSNYSNVTFTFTTVPPNNPIYFNSLGTPVDSGGMSIGTDQSVTVTYNGTQQITITAGTGRVSY